MLKFKLLILFLCTGSLCLGQFSMPELVPPSPEASTFIKAGMGRVNFSTGAINSSIPLYEKKGMLIKDGDYIGRMSMEGNKKQARLVISQGDKALNFDKHLSYILKK